MCPKCEVPDHITNVSLPLYYIVVKRKPFFGYYYRGMRVMYGHYGAGEINKIPIFFSILYKIHMLPHLSPLNRILIYFHFTDLLVAGLRVVYYKSDHLYNF